MARDTEDASSAQVRVCPRCGARSIPRDAVVSCPACAVATVLIAGERGAAFVARIPAALRIAYAAGRLTKVRAHRRKWAKHVRSKPCPGRPSGTP